MITLAYLLLPALAGLCFAAMVYAIVVRGEEPPR